MLSQLFAKKLAKKPLAQLQAEAARDGRLRRVLGPTDDERASAAVKPDSQQ